MGTKKKTTGKGSRKAAAIPQAGKRKSKGKETQEFCIELLGEVYYLYADEKPDMQALIGTMKAERFEKSFHVSIRSGHYQKVSASIILEGSAVGTSL